MTSGVSSSDLTLLSSPFQVGSMHVRNRVVMAPHSTHYADRLESERLTAYYAARAAAQVGLIVHEPVIVHRSSLSRVGKIWGYDEGNAEAYRRTTDAVHDAGGKIVCQLIHNGRQVDGFESQMPAWYPSEVVRGGTIEVTHAMTPEDIEEVVAGFVRAAQICAAGGFDGVEIHAAHGYLLQGFLSPATNSREDDYGGSLPARVRVVQEVLRAVREAVGAEFVIGIRLPGTEAHPGGLDEADCVEIARLLAHEVDYISVVSGSLATFDRIVPDMSFPRGLNVGFAAQIRAAVAPVPVLVTGRIAETADAERILQEGSADLIGVARSLIADAEWFSKAVEGRAEEVRPCVYANDCRDSIAGRRSMECMVNPTSGHERETVPVNPVRRRVVVVGGGVAGMEAALAAADQGDDVVLFERSAALGGQMLLASQLESRSEFGRLPAHLAGRIARSAIEVRLGVEPDAETLRAADPHLVVVATGAVAARDAADPSAIVALDVVAGAPVHARRVVVEDRSGGNAWPLFTAAEMLAERGHEVVLVLSASALGTGVESGSLLPLRARLRALGVRIDLMSTAERCDGGVRVRRSDTGEVVEYADAVLVGEFGRRSAGAVGAWSALGVEVRAVGDVVAPRRVATAIREARAAVRLGGD